MKRPITPYAIALALPGLTAVQPALAQSALVQPALAQSALAQSSLAQADPAPAPLCGDVVVLGEVHKSTFLRADSDGWNGVWKMEIDVRRVLRGPATGRRIVAIAGGEGQMRSATPFVFVLSKGTGDGYGVLTAYTDLGRARAALKACEP